MNKLKKVFKTLDEQIFYSEEKANEYIEKAWGKLYKKLDIDFKKDTISVFIVYYNEFKNNRKDFYDSFGILILESFSNLSAKDKILFAEWHCYNKFGNSVKFINDLITTSCIYRNWEIKLMNKKELKLFLRDNRNLEYENNYKYIQHRLTCNFVENIECSDLERLQDYKNNH